MKHIYFVVRVGMHKEPSEEMCATTQQEVADALNAYYQFDKFSCNLEEC